jgi:hypothetical protein
MNDADRLRLLFGPYQAPAVKRGDVAFCLVRDYPVLVTGWSGAPIPWPRCRPLDCSGAGSGLLVNEELARAVRHEAAVAVAFWWGVSPWAVCRWRKALGVTRTENEATMRLVQAAAELGAAELRGRALPPEQVERRRRTAAELGLGRNLVLGYHGPCWVAQDLALLRTLPDAEVARRTGRGPNAVRQMRERLGLPNPAGNRWTAEGIALLGTLPDREVARRLGRSLASVTQKRIKLGIAKQLDERRRVRLRPPHRAARAGLKAVRGKAGRVIDDGVPVMDEVRAGAWPLRVQAGG